MPSTYLQAKTYCGRFNVQETRGFYLFCNSSSIGLKPTILNGLFDKIPSGTFWKSNNQHFTQTPKFGQKINSWTDSGGSPDPYRLLQIYQI